MRLLHAVCLWFIWFFWEALRCEHEPGDWLHVNFGMEKIRHCRKCGQHLDTI